MSMIDLFGHEKVFKDYMKNIFQMTSSTKKQLDMPQSMFLS